MSRQPKFTTRPLSLADLRSWCALRNEIARSRANEDELTLVELREVVSRSWVSLDRDSICVLDQHAQMVGWGRIDFRPPSGTDRPVCFALGGVHPGQLRRGIGTIIMAHLVDIARFRMIDSQLESRAIIRAFSPADQGASMLLMQFGFALERVLAELILEDLAVIDLPASGVRTEVAVGRPKSDEDLLGLRATFNECFGSQWGGRTYSPLEWRELFQYVIAPRTICIHATGSSGSGTVGFAINILDATGETVEAHTEYLGVKPGWRRIGIGRVLLLASLEAMKSAGAERTTINVDVDNPSKALDLYRNLGYSIRRTTNVLSRTVYAS